MTPGSRFYQIERKSGGDTHAIKTKTSTCCLGAGDPGRTAGRGLAPALLPVAGALRRSSHEILGETHGRATGTLGNATTAKRVGCIDLPSIRPRRHELESGAVGHSDVWKDRGRCSASGAFGRSRPSRPKGGGTFSCGIGAPAERRDSSVAQGMAALQG